MEERLSTEMVGETPEKHCEIEINETRSTAFPRAYFEKDNDARTGSKGDYIWKVPAGADWEASASTEELDRDWTSLRS